MAHAVGIFHPPNREVNGASAGGAITRYVAGNIAFSFKTVGMYRGWIGADGVPHVAVFRDDALTMP